MSVLNANIRSFDSNVEVTKMTQCLCHSSFIHMYFVLSGTVEMPHEANSAVLFYFLICAHVSSTPSLQLTESGKTEKKKTVSHSVFLSSVSFLA